MKKLLLLFLIVLAFSELEAQENYIVLTDAKKIEGKVYFDLQGRYGQDKVAIRSNGELSKFIPSEVEEVMIDDQKYVSIKIKKKHLFAEVIEEGVLSYYLFVDEYNTKRLDFKVKTLIKEGNKPLEINAQGFKGKFKEMVFECDSAIALVNSKGFSKNAIREVVRSYNECIEAIQSNELIDQSQLDNLTQADALTLQTLVAKVTDSNLENKPEVNEMLSDVIKRLDNKEKIPVYLKNAVLNSFEGHQDWKDMFVKLID